MIRELEEEAGVVYVSVRTVYSGEEEEIRHFSCCFRDRIHLQTSRLTVTPV